MPRRLTSIDLPKRTFLHKLYKLPSKEVCKLCDGMRIRLQPKIRRTHQVADSISDKVLAWTYDISPSFGSAYVQAIRDQSLDFTDPDEGWFHFMRRCARHVAKIRSALKRVYSVHGTLFARNEFLVEYLSVAVPEYAPIAALVRRGEHNYINLLDTLVRHADVFVRHSFPPEPHRHRLDIMPNKVIFDVALQIAEFNANQHWRGLHEDEVFILLDHIQTDNQANYSIRQHTIVQDGQTIPYASFSTKYMDGTIYLTPHEQSFAIAKTLDEHVIRVTPHLIVTES